MLHLFKSLILLLALLVVSLVSTSQGGKLVFNYLTSKDGLVNDNVYSIFQDHKGFLWIGTENGLHRYDGINFTLFEHDPDNQFSIGGNVIFKIFEDLEHALFICTNAGFERFNPADNSFTHIPTRILSNGKYKLNYELYCPTGLADREGNIYISEGANGIFKLNKDSLYFEKMKFYDEKGREVNMGIVTSMCQDSRGVIWMGSKSEGVFSVDLINNTIKQFSLIHKSLNSNNVFSIHEDQKHRLWVGTDNGLNLYDPVAKTFIKKETGIKTKTPSIYVMSGDREGNVWLGTNGDGLIRMDAQTDQIQLFVAGPKETHALGNNFIRVIYEDRQQNLWVGTQRGGISYSLKNNAGVFRMLRKEDHFNSLSYNSVDAILQNTKGNFWFGTDGGGLNFYDPEKKKFTLFNGIGSERRDKPFLSVLTIFEDKTGEIWAGGYLEGLCKLNRQNNTFKRYRHDPADPNSLGHDDVRAIWEDSKGNFWVATNGGGLNLMDRNSPSFKRFSEHSANRIASDYCITLFEDSRKRIWLGTYSGFSILENGGSIIKTFKATRENGLSSHWIYCIYEDSKGRYWIGTDYGLNLFDEASGKFTSYLKKDGLPNNVIAGILEDENGKLWISTNGGLSKFDPETKKFNNFNSNDGLPGNHFNHGAYWKSSSGILYFGATNGLVYFNPSEIKINKEEPPVYITDLILANRKIVVSSDYYEPDSIVKLDYSQASYLNFRFSALNFINAEKNQYQYFLEGFDKDWRSSGNQQSVTYTNLNPGNYIFHVRASNNDGIWSSKSAKLVVEIIPPFYRTIWAYIFYTLVIFSLLYFFIRYALIRTAHRKELEIEIVKREKTEEIARLKTNFFTNISHELSTPLTLILAPLQQMKDASQFDSRLMQISWNNAQRLQKLVRELLDVHKIEEGKERLLLAKTELHSFIKTNVESFKTIADQKKISLNFDLQVPLKEVYLDIDKIEKVLGNLLSNAFKYTPFNGKIDLLVSEICPDEFSEVNKNRSFIYIRVKDSGIGIPKEKIPYLFDKYYRAEELQNGNPLIEATGYGIGLYYTKSLVELHKGEIHVKSKMNMGSSFLVCIPGNLLPDNYDVHQTAGNVDSVSIENEFSFPTDEENDSLRKEAPLVLIAEDNPELNEVIEGVLKSDYKILKAFDGLEAWKLICRHQPDLIITDIMMPGMDGIALCEKIKKDFDTCHIPVVMLTALNTDEYKLKGIEFGADDYITKPFNPKILSTRVAALIESRKVLQKKFLTDYTVKPSEVTVNSSDEKFLQDAIAVIEKHMENPDFDVVQFCKEMNMSDSGLYRKIKGITTQSPNQFIRTVRLKRAAQLLESADLTISEICFKVGFNDVKYFRKCFQKQFGSNPGEYAVPEN